MGSMRRSIQRRYFLRMFDELRASKIIDAAPTGGFGVKIPLKGDSMILESVRLLAVVSVAVCLIPAGAHFFELANKMSLSTAEYMTTQKIYAGWSFFGVAII